MRCRGFSASSPTEAAPAANQASWAFAIPVRTLNNPVDAARASAAVDYLAGELSSNPHWVTLSPLTKMKMVEARADVRRVLGIKPDAPAQFVTNGLLQFAWLWAVRRRARRDAGAGNADIHAATGAGAPGAAQHALHSIGEHRDLDAANQMLPGGDVSAQR